jgi:excisionase family DNA binding protein
MCTEERESVTVALSQFQCEYAHAAMPDLEAERFPPILTTAMAAELLHVHVEYLRRMVREGRIPAHRFPGGREIRFHRDELIEWVRAQPGYNRSPSAEESVATD